jgi:FAD:protein FMN transferase
MSPDTFRAMGVEVVVGGATAAERAAVGELFEEWDSAFSRFRPDSELCRVNRRGSEIAVVTPLFARAVRTALRVAAATDGLVDPTLGTAIEAAGYDRDFSSLPADGPIGRPARGRWRSLRLVGPVLSRPSGTRLDLNGVVKALAVDEALGLIAGDAFVAAGGDVAARGGAVVGLPCGGSVRLHAGGVATSGTTYRRWLRGGEPQHHLLDPATGRPARSRWTTVTVAAASCLTADVAAKAAYVLSGEGPDWLDARRLPGRFVDDAGDVVVNDAWGRATAEIGTIEVAA